MREIKFRLILTDEIVGYETHEYDKCSDTINIFHSRFEGELGYNIAAVENAFIPHDNKELSTGLKDMNENEIFEGDIMIWDAKQVGTWSDQCQSPTLVSYPFVCGNAHLGKNIGNIHQNPELMEAEHD